MNNQELNIEHNESAFDLADLFSLLWQRKFQILILTALLSAIGGYYATKLPKIYSATATLLLSENQQNIRLPSTVAQLTGSGDSKIDTYIEFIRSRQFIGLMVDDLELTKNAEFRSKLPNATEERNRSYAIEMVKSNLTLSRVDETYMLRVRYESQVADITAKIVNYVGPKFFAFHSEMTRNRADAASAWLNRQLDELQAELNSSEAELQDYLNRYELVDVRSQIDLVRTEVSALLHERMAANKSLSEKRVTVEQVRKHRNDQKRLMHVPWILNNSLVIEIRNRIIHQQQNLAEVAKRYKPKHHKYIAAQVKLQTLNDEQTGLLNELIESLEKEFAANVSRQDSLDMQLVQAKERHRALGEHELELSRLQRNVDSNQRLYNAFVSRLRETEILKDLGENQEFAVVEFAAVPRSPSKPQVKLLIVVIVMFSGMFSCVFALAQHFVSDQKTRYRNILNKMHVPLLAEIPRISTASKSKAGIVNEGERHYGYSEAIRNLRTNIMIQAGERPFRLIGVCSVKKGSGKTTMSYSLAKAFGALEKTLLVDADLREPSVADIVNLDAEHPGLTDFIARKVKFSGCVHKETDSQLSVLPSGSIPNDPMMYISKQRFANIIKRLGVFYDRLIVEASSLEQYNDALIISRYLDGIILVCDIEETEVDELVDAIQRLRDSGAPLLGVVVNKVKTQQSFAVKRSEKRGFLNNILPSKA